MYKVAKILPVEEKFGLAGQIRRAAVSLTNNIAEGHGRYHYPDQIRFNLQARGSLEELSDDLNVCEDEEYETAAQLADLKVQGWRVHQVLNGYIRFLRGRINSDKRVREGDNEEDCTEILAPGETLQRFNP